ncbi:C-GCAxxG-C-C family (seleno)protein, partial [Enterococcus faecalis]
GGAKCICGALSGGVMCLGYFFGRTEAKGEQVNKTMALANELHQSFRQKHRVVCCSILTSKMTMGSPEHMEQCIGFTGEIAETTAKIIARELAYDLV